MSTLSDTMNANLRAYMDSSGLSFADLEKATGIPKSNLYKRVAGVHRWTLDDLDRLIEAGIPVYLPLYGGLDMEVSA